MVVMGKNYNQLDLEERVKIGMLKAVYQMNRSNLSGVALRKGKYFGRITSICG